MFDLSVTFDKSGGIAKNGPMRDIDACYLRKISSAVLVVVLANDERVEYFSSLNEALTELTSLSLVCSTALLTEALQHKEMRFAHITRVHRVFDCDVRIDLTAINKILSTLKVLTTSTRVTKFANQQVITYDTTQYYR